MFKVEKQHLLLVAGVVWLAAGINILRIGILSFITAFAQMEILWLALLVLAATVILLGFTMMFRRVVKKHICRILGYEGKKSIFLFFDLKGYLLMAFMMGLGIGLRGGGFLPGWFFAFFYTGLGSALVLGGLQFAGRWVREIRRKG